MGGIPQCLKGSSFGIIFFKKRGLEFFWCKERDKKYSFIETGERLYRGKHQDYYTYIGDDAEIKYLY